jgi:glycogen operon protein
MNSVGNAGHSWPLGATVVDGGINFSVFSRSATSVELLLFDREDDARPARMMRLDPAANRTYHYWHVCVPGIRPGQLYGYRVAGPYDPANGMRFDPPKSSSTRMVVAWLCQKTTIATQPGRPAIMLRQR